MKVVRNIGNTQLWEQPKTLFLCSKHAPLACYENVFQWVEDFDKQGCAVCFNTTELESEVIKALLVCHVPTVLVVMGRFQDNYNVQVGLALKENRLLIMELQREKSDGKGITAALRNRFIISQVQNIVCGYINPKGSIAGLLRGLQNVTYLTDYSISMAAEEEPKKAKWTVAEDKHLLSMFYEDMGIHAIHKAIGRPYSTIYIHTKSLAMNDEALKGRAFEDYVVNLLDLPHNSDLILKEWRGDKSIPGVYPESNSAPDLLFSYKGSPFSIECKWRNHMPNAIGEDVLTSERRAYFQQYAKEYAMPVFLILGIGGLPSEPEDLYMAPASATLSIKTILQGIVHSPSEILQRACASEEGAKKKRTRTTIEPKQKGFS